MFSGIELSSTMLVTLVGISIVFLVLLLLILILYGFGRLAGSASNHQEKPTEKKAKIPEIKKTAAPMAEDEAERIAVITAAAMEALGSDGKAYEVRSIKPVRSERPIWATAGILENSKPFGGM